MRKLILAFVLAAIPITSEAQYFCGVKPVQLPPLGCNGGQLVCINGLWVWVGCR